METVTSIKPLLAVLVPLLAPLCIVLARKNENMREACTFVAAFLVLFIVASMYGAVSSGTELVYELAVLAPGIPLAFRVDSFGLLFGLVAAPLWILTSLYSIGYMRGLKEHSQTRYFCFFAVAISATIGVAFAANLFTLYAFYEMLSLATYPLVTHHQDAEARSAGRKYLFYILGTSIGFLLPAMLTTYWISGSLDFTAQGVLPATVSGSTVSLLLFLYMFGFAKAGVMPVHSWLPGAMVAPTPVSALLHAVAVVKVGVFSFLRVVLWILGVDRIQLADLDVFSLDMVACSVASFTVIAASLIALSQDGLKRRLAFSTIGQLAYIVLGVLLLSSTGIMASMLHITMHAFGKITLFMVAGAIYVHTGKKYISQMAGIGRQLPITMIAFLIGSMSVIGLPPTGGFISKWALLVGSIEANKLPFLFVYLLSSVLAAAYFFPIVIKAFFPDPGESQFEDKVNEVPPCCLIPIIFTAVGTLMLFFFPEPFYSLAANAARVVTGG